MPTKVKAKKNSAATKSKDAKPKGKSEDESSQTTPTDEPNDGSQKSEAEKSDKSDSEEGEEPNKSESEEEDRKSESEEDRPPGISRETTKGGKRMERECRDVLIQIGKRHQGKFDLSSKAGLEAFSSFLVTNQKHAFSTTQLKSIWDACVSAEHKTRLKYVMLDNVRKWDNKNKREDDPSKNPPFLKWHEGRWCDGGKSTATIEEMAWYVKEYLLPHAGENKKLVETPPSEMRKEAAEKVAKAMCSETLLLGQGNCNPQSAMSVIQDIFSGYL